MEESATANAPSSSSDEGNKAAQCSATSIYQVNIGGARRNVSVVWCKSIINHSFSVSVDKPGGECFFTCKVELKPWPFWSKKGFKSFDVEGRRIHIFWDLRSAKFSGGAEPAGGYYVALVYNEEVVLLLGDCKKEAYKRTKSRPSLEDPTIICKRENVFGKKSFVARARFDERKKEHEILVENTVSSSSGPKEPEMWISVDGAVVIHVNNLQWKFRGNETVVVEEVAVQVFWDVHDWLFAGSGSGHALFIFKPEVAAEGGGGGGRSSPVVVGEEEAEMVAVPGSGAGPEFCFFMYAWRTE